MCVEWLESEPITRDDVHDVRVRTLDGRASTGGRLREPAPPQILSAPRCLGVLAEPVVLQDQHFVRGRVDPSPILLAEERHYQNVTGWPTTALGWSTGRASWLAGKS
jgi:hypothetical protein